MKKNSEIDYIFPKSLIAQHPTHPRDAAHLLIYDRRTRRIRHDIFRNLSHYLPPRSVLVFNETKVVPARLMLRKSTGGTVEALIIGTDHGRVKALANRKLAIGNSLHVSQKVTFTIVNTDGRLYYLKPSFPIARLHAVLKKYGHAPVPPYIKHSKKPSVKLREEYQTIFARNEGSIAAPTASLHFTKRLLADLKRHGHDVQFVTLHVGLGTFAPVTDMNLRTNTLHQEDYSISKKTAAFLDRAKKQNRPIIAVGTTVVRTLESACTNRGSLTKLSGSTDLFIREGFAFKYCDGIITNFHVPRSSLLMLVSAFCSRDQIMTVYHEAIEKKYRLFSFGDGMLLY